MLDFFTDLGPANLYLNPLGMGTYHSGVEVFGSETTFGGNNSDGSGVFTHTPREAPGAQHRESISMGLTNLSASQVRAVIDEMRDEYRGSSYHLLLRNCNHFSADLCVNPLALSFDDIQSAP